MRIEHEIHRILHRRHDLRRVVSTDHAAVGNSIHLGRGGEMKARQFDALRRLVEEGITLGRDKTHDELRKMGLCRRVLTVPPRYVVTPAGRAKLEEMEKAK